VPTDRRQTEPIRLDCDSLAGRVTPCALAACEQTFKILAYRVCLRRLLTRRRVNLDRVNSGTMVVRPPQQGSLGGIHDFANFWGG